MSSGSYSRGKISKGEAFIKAFGQEILKKIGLGLGEKFEVIEEGLEGAHSVNHYVMVRSVVKPEVTFKLSTTLTFYDSDSSEFEELVEEMKILTDLTQDEIEFRLQEAGLR